MLSPTRAAGALALFGALAGASVAAASTGPSFLAEPASDTGELVRPTPSSTPDTSTGSTSTGDTTSAAAPTTTTTAPPATTTPAVPKDDGGKTLWSADFAGSGLDNFKSTPWNVEGGAKLPSVSGGLLNVTMPGGGKRSEVEPDFANFTEGDDYFVGFSVRLDPNFPVDTSDWQVISQFKNMGSGTPPLELKVQGGKFVIDGDGGAFSQVVGQARAGQWTHLVLKVKFSSSDGTVSAWQDGLPTLSDYAPPGGTLYSGSSSYLKIGIYRDPSIGQTGKLSFGSYAIGTSLGSVSKDVTTAGRE